MQQTTRNRPASGADPTLLLAALRRTPRERFQRGIQLYRLSRRLRTAKPVTAIPTRS